MANTPRDAADQVDLTSPTWSFGVPPRRSIKDMMADARQNLADSGISMGGPGAPGQQSDTGALLKDALATFNQEPKPKEGMFAGTGRAALAGVGQLGAQVAGAGEYAANQLGGYGNQVAQGFHTARTTAQNFAQNEIAKLTPEEQDEMAREWTTLDPHRTIWQGGPHEFVHSVALQAAQAAPSQLAMLWPAGRMIKAGMTAGALTYVGATQTGLSMGSIASNIADDINKADENSLRQNSPEYAQMVNSGVPPEQARQQLIQKAQAYAPVVGGLVSGSIATLAGRFLTPVLSKEGAGLGARLAGGAADQAIQGAGSAGADYIARETAAHTYDNKRAPNWQGLGQAAVEAGATGAITGAAFGAISGHGKVPQPAPKKPAQENLPNQQNPGEVHQSMPSETDEEQPIERNREGETLMGTPPPVEPHPITPGQQELDLQQPSAPGVPEDQAAAIRAKYGVDVGHWSTEEPEPGHQGGGVPATPGPDQPPGWGMQEPNGPQGNLDLRGGQMNSPRPGPTPPVAAPAQLNLPLRERVRGGINQPPVAEPPQPTRADQLRQRAADQQQGTLPDVNQPDLFRDQNVSPTTLTTVSNRPMVRGTPEASSSLVPFEDLRNQLQDLQDPSHPRQAMYLDADNLERLRQNRLLDPLRDKLVNGEQMLPNFDRKGGALVTDNAETAKEALELRDNKVATPEEIIQHLSHDTLDRSPVATLQRARKLGIEDEVAQRGIAQKETGDVVRRELERHVTDNDDLVGRGRRATETDLETEQQSRPVSRQEAASRLTAEARRVHNETESRARPGGRIIDPGDLVFASEDAERRYRELHNEYLGAEIMENSARNPTSEGPHKRALAFPEGQEAAIAHAVAGRDAIERKIATFLKTHAVETKAKQVARAAVAISPEGVREHLKTPKEEVEPHPEWDITATGPLPHMSRAEVHELSDEDLKHLYENVIERRITREEDRPDPVKLGTAERDEDLPELATAETTERDERELLPYEIDAKTRTKLTREQILAEDKGQRSNIEKRVNRYFRNQARIEELGRAKSQPFAASPGRALTAREERVNEAKMGTRSKRMIGYKTFDPTALMSTIESQREMERSAGMSKKEARAERVQRFNDLSESVKYGEKQLKEMLKLKRDDISGEESPLTAHQYMRELLRYGNVLKVQGLRSPEARAAAKKFIGLMDSLGNKDAVKRAEYLINTYKTEMRRQNKSAARFSPESLTHWKDLPDVVAKQNARLMQDQEARKAVRGALANAVEEKGGDPEEDAFIKAMDADIARENAAWAAEIRNEEMGATGARPREAGTPSWSGKHESVISAMLHVEPQMTEGKSVALSALHDETLGQFGDKTVHDEISHLIREGILIAKKTNLGRPLTPREKYLQYEDAHGNKYNKVMLAPDIVERLQNRYVELGIEDRDETPEERAAREPTPEDLAGRPTARYPTQEEFPDRENLEDDEKFRSALGYPQNPTAIDSAAKAGADKLEQGVSRAHEILPNIINQLTPGSPFHKLFTQLSKVIDHNTIVGYKNADSFTNGTAKGHTEWQPQGPVIGINRDSLEEARMLGQNPSFQFLHTLGHELAHVATTRAIESNPLVKQRLESVLATVRQQEGANQHYGSRTNSVTEMVAEAYSNPRFQRFLDSVKIAGTKQSLWGKFKQIVADILGYQGNQEHYSALDAIMREHGAIFKGKQYATTPGEIRRLKLENLEHDEEGSRVGGAIDRLMKSVKLDGQTMKNLASDATEGLGQWGLSAMTPRQMRAAFGKYFQKGEINPYERYMDNYFKRASDNAVFMEKVGKLSNAWSNLEDKFGDDMAKTVSKLMNDARMYQFHPDLPLAHPDNEHLVSPEQISRQKNGQAVYDKLPAEWQEHYQTVKKYYATARRDETMQIVLNGLHGMLTKGEDAPMTAKQFDAKYTAETIAAKELNTEDGLRKEFGDELSDSSIEALAKIGNLDAKSPGPYFPLMRDGDYVVSAERPVESKEFSSSKDAQAYAQEQRQKDPTLSINVERIGDSQARRVIVTEKDMRLAKTQSEANQHRQDMIEQYGKENVKPVRLKKDLFTSGGDITTDSALNKLMRALSDNPAAQNAVKEFYIRSLAEKSFRKRQLRAANRRGVDVENQHQSFVKYGRSQSYYLSQLKYGRHLANALGDVHKMVDDHRDESEVSAVRLGQIARELTLRDKISSNPYEVSDLVHKGTSLTQFMMLTSPSHWFVRAAQPYMLSAPWLAARHGLTDSVGALGRAQSMIADPLLKETVTSGLGLKALFSRAAAERSYSVMDQIMAHVTDRAGADAPKINAMLEHLRHNNLIDLSMATELSDIAKGKSTGIASRVLDASRIMLHLIEVNNRVMTAIAARDLALKKGMTEEQAIDHAAEAINVTHNDYSYGNTPRMFMAQSKGLLGGARPLMFQFMKYPQQIYGMLISSSLAALRGKTPEERAIGVKSLLGYLGTHLIAAGAVGATIQPIKWAIGALMAGASAIGATSQPYTVAGALSGDTYDNWMREVMNDLFGTEMGELVSKGLPTAIGVDLSQRMALGSTYQFHLKTDSDASTIGSIAESVGGPWLNVGENFWDAGKKFLGGDILGAIQNMSPHLIRDIIKAGLMSQKGVVDNRGTTLIPAENLSPGQIFAQSLGFRPDAVAETLDRNAAERNTLYAIRDQQKAIIQKFASAEPNDRESVRAEVLKFNQQHPGFAINSSMLLRAAAQKQADSLQMQKYGARVRGRQIPEITQAGDVYNTQR